MEIDIFIRSYYRDWEWLNLALQSTALFVTGFRCVVVVIPRSSVARMDLTSLEKMHRVRVEVCDDYRDDYLGQQVTKLYADTFTDAEVIVHLDSDQVFVEHCDLRRTLIDGSKVKIGYQSGNMRPAADGWRKCVPDFFGRDVAVDVTGPLPLAIQRLTYAELRRMCRDRHGLSLADYAQARSADRFSELALLRAVILIRGLPHYTWLDLRDRPLIAACRTFWSRAQSPEQVRNSLPPELSANP